MNKETLTRILTCLTLLAGVLWAYTSPTAALDTPEAGHEAPPPAPIAATNGRAFTLTFYADRDTYIDEASPTTNFGLDQHLQVGVSGVDDKRALLHFDISALPANAVVLTATLELYSQYNRAPTPDLPTEFTVYADSVDEAWDETSVTWDTRPSHTYRGDPAADYVISGWTEWNVTNIVSGWLSGGYANHGILLRTGYQGSAYWSSRQAVYGPRLTVTYITEGSPMILPAEKDTWVDESLPSTNYGDGTYLRTRYSGAGNGNRAYILLQFDTSYLPTDIHVISATLELYSEINRSPTPDLPTVGEDIFPDAIRADWNEMTVSWNNKPIAYSNGDPSSPYQIGWMEWDVTASVRGWVSGTLPNHGIQLRIYDADSALADFKARPDENAPRLTIYYEPRTPDCNPMTDVTVSGPTTGNDGTAYDFSSQVVPVDVTAPFTYTWAATGQTTVTAVTDSPTHTVSFTWATSGTKGITLTVENCGSVVSDTHRVVIESPPPACAVPLEGLRFSGPSQGMPDDEYTFGGKALPSGATTPVTFTWQATGQETRVVRGTSLLSSQVYTWSTLGNKAITLTAANCGSTFVYHHTIEIVEQSALPDLDVTTAWYEADQQRVGFLIQNIGGGLASSGHYAVLEQGGGVPNEYTKFPYTLQPGGIHEAYFDTARACSGSSATVSICADTTDLVVEGDESNNCWSATWPCDMNPPAITSGPTVTTTESTATISWQTDEPCSSEVHYGMGSVYYPSSVTASAFVTDHSVTLTGLDSGTVYHFYILITDEGGTSVNGDETFFETLPPGTDPPVITLLEVTTATIPYYDFYTVHAAVDDTVGLERIEFYYDGVLLGSDYFYPGHLPDAYLVFSPYALGYTWDTFFGADHAVMAKAVNLNGAQSTESITHSLAARMKPGEVEIVSPGVGEAVYVISDPAPADTALDVTVRAAVFGWHCTYTSFSESLPPGAQAVDCDDLDDNVSVMGLYLDDVLISSYSPAPDEFEHTFHLDLSGKSVGTHTLKAVAYGDGASYTQQRTFDLSIGEPGLSLERKVSRTDNYFEVELTISNDADAQVAANVTLIFDELRGFQVIQKDTHPGLLAPSGECPNYSVEHFQRAGADSTIRINFGEEGVHLEQGESCTVSYIALPVLHEYAPGYSMGEGGSFTHSNGKAVNLFALSGDLSQMAMDAFRQADYLIVTNPDRLKMYYSGYGDGVGDLLSEMARLAQVKRGALGYLDSYYDKYVLDDLVEPGGYWSDSMYPDFKWIRQGYLLIVGESEIVGGWSYTGLDTRFEDSDVDYVHYSDHAYANTKGDGAPDLIVGRIIGNTPHAMRDAIRTGIKTTTGLWQMDRSHALVVSGRGHYVNDFQANANSLTSDLTDDGWNVTKLHWRDYRFLDSFPQDFLKNDGFAAGDVIAGGKAEMVIARRSGDHFIILDGDGNVVGGFDRSFDEGDVLAVGDVGWDEAAEIIVGDADDGDIYIYNSSGTELARFPCGFTAFDGLTTGHVDESTDKDSILYGSGPNNRIYAYDTSGNVLFSLGHDFDAHDGLASGDIYIGYQDTLDEIVIWHNNRVSVYDSNNNLNGFFDRPFEVGERLAVGNVHYYDARHPEQIIIGDRDDHVYVYQSNGWLLSADHVGEFEAYDGLAVADVTGDEEEEILMADRDDWIHLVDAYYPGYALDTFKSHVPGQDVIYFTGHGSAGSWGPALNTGSFPLGINNTRPFVFAPSCLTGNYEGNNDHSLAEAFLADGAAVYIGSTEISSIPDNVEMGIRFFSNWNANESIGSTLTQIERQVWDANDWASDMWEMWVYEYNLYGDPKIGTDGTVLPLSREAQVVELTNSTRSFHVPLYEVETISGTDYVSIPGGQRIIAQGQYAVPYWEETLTLRPNVIVEDVTLVSRAGLTVTTGLSLPLTAFYKAAPRPTGREASPAADDAWYPELDRPYRWSLTEGEEGNNLLTVEMYPFFYNPATGDVRFYQDFTFTIQTTSTALSILSLDTDRGAYSQGDPVTVTLVISNAGSATDVIVEAAIKAHPDTPVAELPLRDLHDLSGLAFASFVWDSGSTAPGDYFVAVRLRDGGGHVLREEMEEFTLGQADGQVTSLTAAPESFTVGDTVTIALTFENTGTVSITGTATVLVRPVDTVTATAEFTQPVTNLSPGASVVITKTWNTISTTEEEYQVLGYVRFDSRASTPREVTITRKGSARLYLPLVLRNMP